MAAKVLFWMFAFVLSVLTFDLEPGDFVPTVTLKTLQGPLAVPNRTVFYALDNRSAFVECLWTKDESVDHLVLNSTADVHYIFMSYASNPLDHVMWMQNRLKSRLSWLSQQTGNNYEEFIDQCHFVVEQAGHTNTWIDWLLKNWTCRDFGCGIHQLNVTAKNGNLYMRRLDARYDWVFPGMENLTNKTISLVDFGDGCVPLSQNLTEKLALIYRGGPSNCTFFTKFLNAQLSNASGVIVYSTPNLPLIDMNCQGNECNLPISIPGTMISFVDGIALKNALSQGNVDVTIASLNSAANFFGIDNQQQVQETGWLLYPSFLFLTWQGEWFDYMIELNKNLSKPADIIPVFNHAKVQGIYGASTLINIPSQSELDMYRTIELDMSLFCPGMRDSSCAIWDHIVSLYICCDESGPYCRQELGRWITPFRRRIGRWLTPITPLRPFFDDNICNLTMKLDAYWAMPWMTSLNIRLSDKVNSSQVTNATIPYRILPLFRGGTFNQSYNSQYKPILFTVNSTDVQVKLESVITGHGSDNYNCAEFCVTSHHFIINSQYKYVQTFSNAGSPLGCARRVLSGVEPNEHGTWLYGRDGWCDGQEVMPYVVDITDDVHQGMNNVVYFGWYNGSDPKPSNSNAYIVMYSNLVFYKEVSYKYENWSSRERSDLQAVWHLAL